MRGESKTLLYSGFQVLDSGSLSVELGFRIPIVSGFPDSLNCIPDSKAQKSGFHSETLLVPNPIRENLTESGIWLLLHRANS